MYLLLCTDVVTTCRVTHPNIVWRVGLLAMRSSEQKNSCETFRREQLLAFAGGCPMWHPTFQYHVTSSLGGLHVRRTCGCCLNYVEVSMMPYEFTVVA